MKIILIAGSKSSIGKTYVACELLKHLPGWAALKVTNCRSGKCPRGKDCNVCSTLDKDFYIENDMKIISQPNTDTGKMLQAGAKKVIWVRTRPDTLEQAVATVLKSLGKNSFSGLIVEGNSFLEVQKADLSLMVIEGFKEFKPSAESIKSKIDIFLLQKKKEVVVSSKKVIKLEEGWIGKILKEIEKC